METNEIMNNTEVVNEAAEEVVKANKINGPAVVGGVVLAGTACALAYKFLLKPMLDKRARKKAEDALHETVEGEAEEVDSSEA